MIQKPIKEKETPKTTAPSEKKVEPLTAGGSEIKPKDQKQVEGIVKIIEDKTIAPYDAFGKMSKSQVALIKSTIAKGASDDELKLFVQVCKGAQLNPFLKQVHLIPRWDSRSGKEVRTIQVSIDGFRSIAESSGNYAGNDDPIFVETQELKIKKGQATVTINTPVKATATVYKMVAGQKCPFTATARWSEYYPGERMGFQWHTRPYLMLGKCAEALALRKAFPKLLSGMYAQEEMDRTVQVDDDGQKAKKGYDTLIAMIEKANKAELREYKEKVENSPKYNKEQKDQLILIIDAKLANLTQNSPKSA